MDYEEIDFLDLPLKMDAVKGPVLLWDSSDIGDIDLRAMDYQKKDTYNIVYIWSGNNLIECRINKFKDYVPLIADDLKKLFIIPRIGKHKAIFKKSPCILTRYSNLKPLEEFLEENKGKTLPPSFRQEIKRLFAFRYLICLNCNFTNKIEVKVTKTDCYPVSSIETTFSLNPDSEASRIPKNILKEWFEGSEEKLYETCKELIDNRDLTFLRFRIEEIVRKYDHGRHISWVNAIYDRLKTCKNI
jgi:hypothetical protein